MNQRGEHIQPFIIVLGDKNFKRFDKFYVYLDGTKLEFSNFVRALYICFKLFHLFNVEYPKASDVFSSFIGAYFYNIKKNLSGKSTKLNILLKELED